MTNLAPGTLVAEMVLAFPVGVGIGLAHFRLLQRNIEVLVAGSGMVRAAALHALRFAGTGAALYVTARFGALSLLAAAAGLLPGRWIALRHWRGAP